MMYLDTHVIVWLYKGISSQFSAKAKKLMDQSDLLISPIVHLELEYLYEIKKINQPATIVIDELAKNLGLCTCDSPFLQVIKIAKQINWTRDPFDRLIVASAQSKEALLLTKDATIRRHYHHTIWD